MSQSPTALWHLDAQRSVLQSAKSGSDEGLTVRSLYSLISTGTERLVATGQVPEALVHSMAVPFMEGAFSFPVKYGYSLVGRVEEPKHALDQQLVHVLFPHQDLCRVPETALTLIPTHIPPPRAVLASNLETALNAVWDSGVGVGDKVILIGFGNVGSLLARVLQGIPALELTVWDTDPWRQQLAQEMGFHLSEPQGPYDLAFHTAGHEEALQTCIDQVGYEGRVVELSWYGSRSVNLQLGGNFHVERKQLISSQVSRIPTDRLHRWDYARRKAAVFRLLADPAYDQHITDWVPFPDLPAWFDQLRHRNLQGLMWGVRY